MLTLRFNSYQKHRAEKSSSQSYRDRNRAVDIQSMRSKGMTQKEIADSLGITRSAVVQYMKRHYIS